LGPGAAGRRRKKCGRSALVGQCSKTKAALVRTRLTWNRALVHFRCRNESKPVRGRRARWFGP
jgi:hypothetical protein